MLTVLLALLAGIAIGYAKIIPEKYSFLTGYVTWLGLFVLLLTMGVKVGSDEKVLANIGQLGIKAFILAFFSIIFSILCLFLLEKYYFNGQGNKNKAGEST